jgi:hypothetical protein
MSGYDLVRKFREMQTKNSKESLHMWKPKIAPNRQGQRKLIAKKASIKFINGELMKTLNERIETGLLGRPVSAPADLGLGTDFPDLGANFPTLDGNASVGSQDAEFGGVKSRRKINKSRKNKSEKSSNSILVGKALAESKKASTLNKWQNRKKEEKKEEDIIFRQDDRPKSTSEKRHEFVNILQASYRHVEDGLLHSSISQQMSKESRDPKSIYLSLKKALSSSVEFKLVADAYNTRQNLEMKNRGRNESNLMGMCIILDPATATSGLNVTLRIRYKRNPRYERTHTVSNVSSSQAASPRKIKSAKSLRGGARDMLSSSKKSEPGKEKREVVEVEYMINASRWYRYDLRAKLDSMVESPPTVNGRPMFLPGWEGTMPIFIPAQYIVCQVVATKDDDYKPGMSRRFPHSPESVEIGTLSSTKQESAASIVKHREGDVSLSGFAFSCESPIAGLRILQQIVKVVEKSKTANLMVPGSLPAIHLAALHGNVDALHSLVSNGADVNMLSHPPIVHTALHEAVIGGQTEVIQFLLDMGANERLVDSAGNTPLHVAVMHNDLECMAPLMISATSAKVLVTPNKKGKTPYDLATSNTAKLSVERGCKAHHIVLRKSKSKLF